MTLMTPEPFMNSDCYDKKILLIESCKFFSSVLKFVSLIAPNVEESI